MSKKYLLADNEKIKKPIKKHENQEYILYYSIYINIRLQFIALWKLHELEKHTYLLCFFVLARSRYTSFILSFN